MFDPKEPVQTRDGKKASIVSTTVTEPFVSGGTRLRGQTIAAVVEGDQEIKYFYPSGRFLSGQEVGCDLINVPQTAGRDVSFVSDGDAYTSFEACLAREGTEYPIFKIVREGNKIVSCEVVE